VSKDDTDLIAAALGLKSSAWAQATLHLLPEPEINVAINGKLSQDKVDKVYVMTWEDYRGQPGVFETLERAFHHAAGKGVTGFKEIYPGVWKSGTWFIDECAIIPDFELRSVLEEQDDD
jgi:hypothetical protein